MKVGIIALLRHEIDVTYFMNKEIWNWHFDDYLDNERISVKLLTIKLQSYEPKIAKSETDRGEICADILDARQVANKDTIVIVQGYREMNINFKDYLFLVNSSDKIVLKTELNSILTASNYCSKIFVKGIFVKQIEVEDLLNLRYEIDFSKVAVNRNRRSLLSETQFARTLSEMWNDLIERNQENSTDKYLHLLLHKFEVFETLNANNCISRVSAEKLHSRLKSRYESDTFFYNTKD